MPVVGRDVRGELRIHAPSLDTNHKKRDQHLRSADFFDVTEYPTVTFSLIGQHRPLYGRKRLFAVVGQP